MGLTEARVATPRRGSVLLSLRYYGRELARLCRLTAPAVLLPALGNTGLNYIAPLPVANLVGRISGDSGTGTTLLGRRIDIAWHRTAKQRRRPADEHAISVDSSHDPKTRTTRR